MKFVSIYFGMMLSNCEINRKCKVIRLNFEDKKLQLHLAEIGFFVGSELEILKLSVLKKTVLIKVLDSCFAIKKNMSDCIEVEYV